ncbi:MAG: hypothetical protein HQL15_00705 [Candidatus Omnitrophica bacterium]|nr:hypothetical protein [Candidatus Omnitrophota bacterium]
MNVQFKTHMLKLRNWATHRATALDAFVLAFITIFITIHPFYLYGQINYFELGLYLPGVDAILKGQIPYRDFLHLRGPLELYFPAWWMSMTSRSFALIPSYFYLGTVVTLVLGLWVAMEVLRTRIFIYILSLSFLARTFPRVSFAMGGGFRFAWGMALLLCLIKYFRKRNKIWLLGAGFFCAIAFFTSIEIGVYSLFLVGVALLVDALMMQKRGGIFKELSIFIFAFGVVAAPIVIFLQVNHALVPMMETYWKVVPGILQNFPQSDPVPRNVLEVIIAMFTPTHLNFKQLTPLYCYLFAFVYLGYGRRDYRRDIFCLSIYGFLLFIGNMRSLWGPGFETAIQPQKILLFFLLEETWFKVQEKFNQPGKVIAICILTGIFLSTVIYSFPRFQKRFFFIKMISNVFEGKGPLAKILSYSGKDLVAVNVPGMKGMVVPLEQSQDIERLYRFMQAHTTLKDPVLFYPDSGVFNFIVNRPFIGRFPVATLSWLGRGWHEEFKGSLEKQKPAYVVTYRSLPEYFLRTQLIIAENRRKYEEVTALISKNYQLIYRTPSFNVWKPKQ